MDNQRYFIWAGVALALYLNYAAWEQDYGAPPPAPAPAPAAATQPAGPIPVPLPASTLPAPAAGAPSASAAAPAAEPVSRAPAQIVHVRTDVLDLDISTDGGEIDRAELLAYPKQKDTPDAKVRLFDAASPTNRFVFQSGLAASAGGAAPDHGATYTVAATTYTLADGQDELAVPLSWTSGNVSVVKTYVLRRGHYAIDLRYSVHNAGAEPWAGFEYGQLVRHYEAVSRSMWNPETYAYRGPAFYDGRKYARIDVDKPGTGQLPAEPVAGGWAGALQHHFAAIFVPDAATPFRYSLDYRAGTYAFAAAGPIVTVAPGATGELHATLYVGPKLATELEAVSPTLTYANDHGKYLTLVAKPLFWLLSSVHRLVGNWGVAIILVTFLIKLAFYKLAETSGRSMARMRNLQPRMKDLQDRYKDNREELGKQMMELYKREKINPVAGCLPMLVQIPVFIAFYWVLLESVEMRHAPFVLWIQDLSSRDPIFILPAIMGATMFIQFKMNPAPPDPMQAKIFAFMPLVMTATMAFFPAGLVLYWITNTGLSILQQWHINKVVAQESKKARS